MKDSETMKQTVYLNLSDRCRTFLCGPRESSKTVEGQSLPCGVAFVISLNGYVFILLFTQK